MALRLPTPRGNGSPPRALGRVRHQGRTGLLRARRGGGALLTACCRPRGRWARIACHGNMHQFVYRQSHDEFRTDIQRARASVGAAAGSAPVGYRGPYSRPGKIRFGPSTCLPKRAFTMTAASSLSATTGMACPMPPRALRWTNVSGPLREVPLTPLHVVSMSLPFSGGAYVRILPWFAQFAAWHTAERGTRPVIAYIHPWELDPEHPRIALRRRVAATHCAAAPAASPRDASVDCSTNTSSGGSTMSSSSPETDPVARYFDRHAEDFDTIYEERKGWLRGLRDQLSRGTVVQRLTFVDELARERTPGRVLDVGCGSGRLGIRIARHSAGSSGAHLAAQMVRLAHERRCRRRRRPMTFLQGDFLAWDAEGAFNLGLAIGLLDYVAHPQPLLDKLVKVTGGRVVASFPKRWHVLVPLRWVRLPARRTVRSTSRRGAVSKPSQPTPGSQPRSCPFTATISSSAKHDTVGCPRNHPNDRWRRAREHIVLRARTVRNGQVRRQLAHGSGDGERGQSLTGLQPRFELKYIPGMVRSIRPVSDARAFRWLHGYFRTNAPDIVHTHSSKAGVLAAGSPPAPRTSPSSFTHCTAWYFTITSRPTCE